MNRDSGFGMGLLVGGLIGVTLGILFAPHSGKETREMIQEKAGEMREKAMEMREKAEEVVEKAKERVESMKGKGKVGMVEETG